METHLATRLTITAAKLIQDRITRIIEDKGAAAYSIFEGSGRGHHDSRARLRPQIIGEFTIVKIEVVLMDRAIVDAIVEEIAQTLFTEHSGIAYIDSVEVLRPAKF